MTIPKGDNSLTVLDFGQTTAGTIKEITGKKERSQNKEGKE